MKLQVVWLMASCLVSMAAHGCSSDSSKGIVSGTVTLDGQPLKSGLIRFIPADGRTPTAEATITDGEYSAQVPLGEKRVSISAPKIVGKRKAYETADSPSVDIVEELLPARYNVTSELTLNVTGGRQDAEFKLEGGM
ncbi:MAG TPA: hypothetical protein VGK58_03120 [Lacipirellulaceae bacterium]